MDFQFRPFDFAAVEVICSWRYPPPYDYYDIHDTDLDDLTDDELFAPSRWGVETFGAYAGADLVGFAELTPSGNVAEIGLGLRPDWTGRGHGLEFVNAVLDLARDRFAPRTLCLKVATFNKRAIRVYERAGFVRVREYMHGDRPFVEMTRPA